MRPARILNLHFQGKFDGMKNDSCRFQQFWLLRGGVSIDCAFIVIYHNKVLDNLFNLTQKFLWYNI